MKEPHQVNWRGTRPKFNPEPVPRTTTVFHSFWEANKEVLRSENIVDPDARSVVSKATGKPLNTTNKFDRLVDPRLAAEIRRQEILNEDTFESLSVRVEAHLASLLKQRGGD